MNSHTIIDLVQANPAFITIFAVAGVAVLFFLFCLTARKTVLLSKRLDAFMKNSSGESIGNIVVEYTQRVEGLENLSGALNKKMDMLEISQRGCVQRVGLVRYNAYQDTGCDLSFSLALLDHDGNGVVLSSLYGRSESIMYAKPVEKGKSMYPLSQEEQEAVNKAVKQGESR